MSRFKQLKPKFKVPSKQVVRKNLNLDAMMATAHNKFIDFPDTRTRKCQISQADALMSGYAMFALKDPSLLAFDQRRNNDEGNLKRVFGLQNVPSDSQMREILDPVDPELFRPLFREIFSQLQRGKAQGGIGSQWSDVVCFNKSHNNGLIFRAKSALLKEDKGVVRLG